MNRLFIFFKNSSNKIVFLCCIILGIVFFYRCKRIEISNGKICYSYYNNGLIIIPLENGKYFLIDTGAEYSFIFSDRLKINSTVMGTALVNKERSLPLKRVDSLQIGNLLIKNNDFVFEEAKNIFFEKDTAIVGIIGMDIFSQKYCYFDIKNQTLTLSDKIQTQIISPFLIFPYKSFKRPLFNLCINGAIFEDVLFDIGYNGFLELLETDKERLKRQIHLQQDTSYDFFGNIFLNNKYIYDTISINGVNFSNQEISYGQKRLLGIKFIKCWSSFVIDPFKKEIEFYL